MIVMNLDARLTAERALNSKVGSKGFEPPPFPGYLRKLS
jgi:hypothetical protein